MISRSLRYRRFVQLARAALITSCLSLVCLPATAETVRLPVNRDTWISSYRSEQSGSNGGAPRIKLKAFQEFSLLDIDPAPLRGRAIQRAWLHLKPAGDDHALRVSVSTVPVPWGEGTVSGYQQERGAATFLSPQHERQNGWDGRGGDITHVTFGQAGSIWRMADATPPGDDGFQKIPVDPQILYARVSGKSTGFVVFDDTGSEWSRNGETVTFRTFPNRFFYSREAGAKDAPFFTVELKDGAPEAAPQSPPSREHPTDQPPAVALSLSEAAPTPHQLPSGFRGRLPTLAGRKFTVIDALDKVDPRTRTMIPPQEPGYLLANHLFTVHPQPQIRMFAARGETVAFQLLLERGGDPLKFRLSFPAESGITAKFFRPGYVSAGNHVLPDPLLTQDEADRARGIGLPKGARFESVWCEVHVPHACSPGPQTAVLTATSGDAAGNAGQGLPVKLHVWNFHLPDRLSFLPEMNSYGLPAQTERGYYRLAHEHRTVLNRLPYSQNGTVIDDGAPRRTAAGWDWSAWDGRFGEYLSGAAFADLPRAGVPIECFYLPLHENWPTEIDPNYNGDYWADRAFPPEYRRAFVAASQEFARHFADRGWCETRFHCYLNNKNNFKRRGWSRASAPWILDEPASFQDFWAVRWYGEAFHEGVAAARTAADAERCFPQMLYRGDISRPQWQRDALDHVLDYNVVGGGAFRKYQRMVLERKVRCGQVVVDYGTTNDVAASNMQPVGWCLDSWTLGSDGVLPWQTIGRGESWREADRLSLFYPGESVGLTGPVPSVRLKAYRRGQQDAEYCTLWSLLCGASREQAGMFVRRRLALAAKVGGTGFTGGEDAGTVSYDQLTPQAVWRFRTQVGHAIDAIATDASPRQTKILTRARTQLVPLTTPPRDPSKAPAAYAVGYEQTLPPAGRPGWPHSGHRSGSDIAPRPQPTGPKRKIVLHGPQVTADTILDFDAPDRNFGDVPRDNRLVRRDRCNVLLLKFSLEQAKLDAAAASRVVRATARFYVWDPSSRGNGKLGVYAVNTPWEENAATWSSPAAGRSWKSEQFSLPADATGPLTTIIVRPDQGGDLADPPVAYDIDVTRLVQAWLSGKQPNHGLALSYLIDRDVDEGHFLRTQILASEYGNGQHTPSLIIEIREL
jgi:hypothetical protein